MVFPSFGSRDDSHAIESDEDLIGDELFKTGKWTLLARSLAYSDDLVSNPDDYSFCSSSDLLIVHGQEIVRTTELSAKKRVCIGSIERSFLSVISILIAVWSQPTEEPSQVKQDIEVLDESDPEQRRDGTHRQWIQSYGQDEHQKTKGGSVRCWTRILANAATLKSEDWHSEKA